MHRIGYLRRLEDFAYPAIGRLFIAGIVALASVEGLFAWQDNPTSSQMAIAPDSDGYLLHRGSGDGAEAVVANAGGVGLQDRSYDLRLWLPDFVLIRRSGKTYLVQDWVTVQGVWGVWDASGACRAGVGAAKPSVDTLQKALAPCQIGPMEVSPPDSAATQEIKESLEPLVALDWGSRETESRVWKLWDESAACRATGIAASSPVVDKLQKALTECRIDPVEIAAAQKMVAQKMVEGLDPNRAGLWNPIEVINQSRIWRALDQAISAGIARQIEP